MFAKTAEKAVTALIIHGAADEQRKTVYIWGMTYILDTLFNIALFALIGALTGMLAETFVFTAAYIILRIYAGGFHAGTPQRCCLFSMLLLTGSLFMIASAEKMGMVLYIMSAAAAAVITVMSPVSSKNKPLDSAEQKNYRRKARLILLAEELIAAAMLCFNINRFFYVFAAAWTALALMLILGCVRNAAE
ncbi:MAG: putative accessory gene regulator protein [Firmicutes bacterium ADurb.BinA205]|nr:MAG: putative accessory gene regulator protein [Firmicutes bacterium ADurb.BinA205]